MHLNVLPHVTETFCACLNTMRYLITPCEKHYLNCTRHKNECKGYRLSITKNREWPNIVINHNGPIQTCIGSQPWQKQLGQRSTEITSKSIKIIFKTFT